MNAKRAGILFCAMVLFDVSVELLMAFTELGKHIGVVEALVASELIMIIPCILAFLFCKEPFGQTFGVRKVRPVLIPLCIVLTWTILPLVTCCNAFTMYFSENEAAAIFENLSGLPLSVIALFTSLIAPVCEEWTFRGILYTGFRKNGSALQAMLITAVLFGLFHANLNQMMYAMVLGIVFAALREVTGSILPSIICHMTVNGGSTLLLLLGSGELGETLGESSDVLTPETVSMLLSLMIPVAAVMIAPALGLLIKIAKTQKALPKLQNIVEGRVREKGHIIGIPLIVGMVICVGLVVLNLVVQTAS